MKSLYSPSMSSQHQVGLPGRPADTTQPPTPSSSNNLPFSSTPYQSDSNFHLLLGASGSVATIKIPVILYALSKHADKITTRLILTKSASEFLQGQSPEQPSLDAIRKLPGVDAIYTDEDEWAHPWTRTATESVPILHIELRKWADLMVIAPLSANSLAKITNGISDGLLTSVVRAWDTDAFVDGIRPVLRGFNERRREKQTKEAGRQRREKAAKDARQVTFGGVGEPWTSAYGFYSHEQGSMVMEQNPELKFAQMKKLLHERFSAISDEEWKRYEEMAEEDRMRWEEEEKARMAPEVYGGAMKPWRPAYGFYMDDHLDKAKEENPDLPFDALAKLLFERWKELPAGQKMPYEKKSMEDKELCKMENKDKEQAVDKSEGGDSWRRGRSAYILFANAMRDAVKQETPGAGFGIPGKLLRERWLALSDDQKKPYEKMSEDETDQEGIDKAKKIIVCPAMNTAMWRQPITMKQVKVLEEEWGGKEGWFEVLRPGSKTLACGDSGMGAMVKWEEIVEVVRERACLDD